MVCVIVIIALITTMFPKERIVSKEKKISDSEIARSMTYPQVVDGEESTVSEYVSFDAFFLRDLDGDGYVEKIRGTCREIGSQDTLYIELKVNGNGRFENGVITINGENFYLETKIPKDDRVANSAIGSNIKKIELNTIENGSQVFLTGVVKSGDYLYSNRKADAIGNDISKYSKINSVTLTGRHVADDGTVTELKLTDDDTTNTAKIVNFNVDWHGRTKAQIIEKNKTYDTLDDTIDEENQEVKLAFEVKTQETLSQLVLSKAYIEGTIPDLNGYAPKSVEITGTNVQSEYNVETRKFTASREAALGEDGKITSSVPRENVFNLKVTYPLEAFTSMGPDEAEIDIRIPVEAYYEGFNNTNEEFVNPYKSNVDSDIVIARFTRYGDGDYGFGLTIGKYVSTPTYGYVVSKKKPLNIYNGVSDSELDDTYIVRWYGYSGKEHEFPKMTMRERDAGEEIITDKFIKSDATEESMEDVTSNIGIYMSNPTNLVGEDGYVKVYDDVTNELLVTFTKDNWSNYSSSNPYIYDVPVKHIRVETSATKIDAGLYVYNIKELDDDYITANYDKEKFDELRHIETKLVGYFEGTKSIPVRERAIYQAPISVANVSINPSVMSTQETQENAEIRIVTDASESSNKEKWLNGSFLLKLPEEILAIETNTEPQISNNRVTITSYDIYEENGSKFIKIMTENESPESFTITLNATITPNPRSATVTKPIELYATNEYCGNYYYTSSDIYDVNNNLNTSEIVNRTSTSVNLVAPNSLLTSQVAKNYDGKDSFAIGPQVALVEKDRRKATIEVSITNNYSSSVSEIEILGRIPTEGNTYAINGKDLGSNYSTTITEAGIQIPDELKSYAKVYYSTEKNPTRDLKNVANGWKSEGINWSEVKSYLIVLDGYIMPKNDGHVFSYEVNIPEGLNYNQVSYSHHAVYFSLNTDQGLYRTSTEPNKLGLMIAKQFDFEITKYQKDTNKVISGVTYSITEENEKTGKSGVTDATGKIKVEKLFAERTYVIKEVRTPSQYALNSEVVKFTTKVNEDGTLSANIVSGSIRKDTNIAVETAENGYLVKVQLDDEVRANLKLSKVEKGSVGVPVKSARYKLTGKGLGNGRIITTNTNGEVTVSGLYINEEYTLEETKVEGYYLAKPVRFKIVNNSGNYELVKLDGEILEVVSEKVDDIPVLKLKIEDEKIPRYNLQINKIVKGTETPLEGAKFRLYKGEKEIGSYVTDVNGNITISNLYQYEKDKNLDQTYTLKEVEAPEGYAPVKDITFNVEKTETGSVMNVTDGKIKGYEIVDDTVVVTLEDAQSFKLVKKDGETGEVLPNTKFAIYNVDDGTEQLARDAKNNILGTKEIINGKEYYTLTTNDKGEIEANLREGLYKAVEVQANHDKYDITGNEYYFGIGASREGKVINWITGSQHFDWSNAIIETGDGGMLVSESQNIVKYKRGETSEDYQIEYTIQAEGNVRTITEASDGGILVSSSQNVVKYKKSETSGNYEIEYTIPVGGVAEKIIETADKGILVNISGAITKYMPVKNEDGSIQGYEQVWKPSISATINSVIETSDGGIVVAGKFGVSRIDLGDKVPALVNKNSRDNDGMIIKYKKKEGTEEYEAIWATSIGGSYEENVTAIVETPDGGIFAAGIFESSIIQFEEGVGDLVNNNHSDPMESFDGMLLKYKLKEDTEGYELTWTKAVGGTSREGISSLRLTSDEGMLVGGLSYSTDIDFGINVPKYNNLTTSGRGILVKYALNENGYEAIWRVTLNDFGDSTYGNTSKYDSIIETKDGKIIVKSGDTLYGIGKKEQTNVVDTLIAEQKINMDSVTTIIKAQDGGIFVGGKFIRDYTNGNSDGAIIKYKVKEDTEDYEIEWLTSISGTNNVNISKIIETSDGGILVEGSFNGDIKVGDYLLTSNNYGIMLIKYIPKENSEEYEVEWATSFNNEDIYAMTKTKDDGILIMTESSKIIKYDKNGALLCEKSLDLDLEGDSMYGPTVANSIIETSDGGFCFTAVTDIYIHNDMRGTLWIYKYNSKNELEWALDYYLDTNRGDYDLGGTILVKQLDNGNYVVTFRGELLEISSTGQWRDASEKNFRQYEIIDSPNSGFYIIGTIGLR